jgi:thiamine biosynthesis lipoprotein
MISAAEQPLPRVWPQLASMALLAQLAIAVTGCGSDAARDAGARFSGETMGTTYRVTLSKVPPSIDVARLEAELADMLATVNAQMSTYRSDSELSKFNDLRSTDWIDVSADLVTVMEAALEVSRVSEGAFDVTVGPLVNLWGFGPQQRNPVLPSVEELEATRARIGYWHLQTRALPPAVKKQQADIYVDLSAIAKGFAVDRLAAHLDDLRVEDYLIEIGGDLRAKGVNARGMPWQVGIERPVADSRVVYKVVAISNQAMATSGDYRNFFARDGQRFSHTLNPHTGRPVTHSLGSVTVVSSSTMHADATATALLVLGPQAGYQLAERENLAALFIVKQDDGFVDKATAAFTAKFPSFRE